ncbi:sodium-dependent nutrient amino acid transporter 1-like [Eriocheir sinensis]|uniref:sodium-dependent nutrient amino acid transporter 1-like n=1 Tax=Eriocheir sinensis TaxID=95602 RepID=UPI0021C84BC9|nr:sodium-dependent nutrient amino acid transporter 1-like [Eriocheir sinensis]
MRSKGKLNIAFEGDEGVEAQRYELKEHTELPAQPSEPPPSLPDPATDKPKTPQATTKEQKAANDTKNNAATRGKWKNNTEFLLSCISMAIGFGNIWRFPFVALENGGGAFLIPYLIVLLFIGRPMYYLELILGQFSSRGPSEVWEMLPAFKGIGYGQLLINWFVSTYYASLMAFCIFFFFASFNQELPWASCGLWASEACMDAATNVTMLQGGTSAAEEYLMKQVLKVDFEGFRSGLGLPDIRLSMCLVASWAVVFMVQIRGIKTSGKAAYFTAIVPYVLLLALLIRGVTLPGSTNGIMYFLTPRWEKLLDIQVWLAAVTQALFSLVIGFGSVITMASYNDFRNNTYVDAAFISVVDTVTSFLSGVTTFAILGHLAVLMGVDLPDVVQGGGTSLAFVSYPDALARFPWLPQMFSALFFFMMFTLGLGSMVAVNSVLITAFKDNFPQLPTWTVSLSVCLLGMFPGLVYTTPQGQHVLTLVNHYSANLSILLLVTLEVAGVAWVYGLRRLAADIHFMLGRSTGVLWKASWLLLNPLFLAGVLVYSQTQATVLSYGDYVFGTTETAVGVVMSVAPVLLVPVLFLVEVVRRYRASGQLMHALTNAFAASDKWGPRDAKIRQEYDIYLEDTLGARR